MDSLEELERLAWNVKIYEGESDEPSPDQVAGWQDLFNFTRDQAIDQIKQHRADLSRTRVPNGHWELVRTQLEGYDREAYDYKLFLDQKCVSRITKVNAPSNARFIFNLGNPQLGDALSTPAQVREIAKLTECPKILCGEGNELFGEVNATQKANIETFLAESRSPFRPTFVQCRQARKEFNDHSRYPTLGLDTTFPQHRPQKTDESFAPSQTQYPVWYFFYGTLADPDTLAHHLKLEERPSLESASIHGGVIKTWECKYKALIDGPAMAKVDGWAYRVEKPEHEEALRIYETDAYEVVRCSILLQNGSVEKGCTFRFLDVAKAV